MTNSELQSQMIKFEQVVRLRDGTEAESVLDFDYALVLVHPTPSVTPRAQWLAMLPDYIVHSWDVLDATVDISGDCAAILQRVDMSATVLGADRSGVFVLSDIWLHRAEGWRIWRRHSTPMSAGPMPAE